MKELIEEGKISRNGLSEVIPDEIRRAHAIHPVCCIEQEWSLGTRDLEQDHIPLINELKIGILAYSPLGRGILTNTVNPSNLPEGDWRRNAPMFNSENFKENLEKVESFAKLAEKKGISPS